MRDWAKALAASDGVVVDRAGEVISVSTRCSTCGCEFAVTMTEKDILAGVIDEPRSVTKGHWPFDWQGVIRFKAYCYCTTNHEGRPSEITHGCGAWGWLRDTPDPG